MNRNDGANLKAVVRRKGRGRTTSSGYFMRIAVLVGCLWILFIMGFVKRFKKNEQAAPTNPVRAGQKPLQAGAQRLDPRRMWQRNGRPVAGKNKVVVVEEEEEEESEVPETGAIHTPNLLPLSEDSDAYRSPLLIFTCRRKEYLSQTLDDILANIGDHCAFGCPVVVSEDGKHIHTIIALRLTCASFRAHQITLQVLTNRFEASLKNTRRSSKNCVSHLSTCSTIDHNPQSSSSGKEIQHLLIKLWRSTTDGRWVKFSSVWIRHCPPRIELSSWKKIFILRPTFSAT